MVPEAPAADGLPERSLPLAARFDHWMEAVFSIVERGLIALVALALIALAVMALWDTVNVVYSDTVASKITEAISSGIDTVFLTVILLELLNTVVRRGPIAQQVQDFIVIGITSGIRHGLALGVSGEANPRNTVINLTINAASVLLLVAGLWLVHQRFGESSPSVGHE